MCNPLYSTQHWKKSCNMFQGNAVSRTLSQDRMIVLICWQYHQLPPKTKIVTVHTAKYSITEFIFTWPFPLPVVNHRKTNLIACVPCQFYSNPPCFISRSYTQWGLKMPSDAEYFSCLKYISTLYEDSGSGAVNQAIKIKGVVIWQYLSTLLKGPTIVVNLILKELV